MPGFYVSRATNKPTSMTVMETLLAPSPVAVDYPQEPLGARLQTADGRLIVQQPALDNRPRAWVWRGYPGWMTSYQTLFDTLENLRSRLRKGTSGSAYIWIKDDVTNLLYRHYTATGSVSSATSDTLTVSGTPFTGLTLADMYVEIMAGTGLGEFKKIVSNTSSQLTVASNWTVTPTNGATWAVRGRVNDWFKARVIEISRRLRDDGGQPRYEETRLVFVIEDAAWNGLG